MTAATLKPMAMAVAIENTAIHMVAFLLTKSLPRPVRHLRKPQGNAVPQAEVPEVSFVGFSVL
jgi:hypothetical protein